MPTYRCKIPPLCLEGYIHGQKVPSKDTQEICLSALHASHQHAPEKTFDSKKHIMMKGAISPK